MFFWGHSDSIRVMSYVSIKNLASRLPKGKLPQLWAGSIWLTAGCGHLAEKAMAPHSSTLAWKIPWMEEPGRLQSMGLWRVTTRLSNFTFTFHVHALEKEMATHSSVLAWRIPGIGEPGGQPSMGSYRVEHDWSNLAAVVIWRKKWQPTPVFLPGESHAEKPGRLQSIGSQRVGLSD